MVAVKMFLDMWRNLTSATTNWSFSGGSGSSSGAGFNGSNKGSSRPTRYNRLRSGPTKSHSQPANLISLATGESPTSSSPTSTSSSESLAKRNLRGETTTSFSMQQEKSSTTNRRGNFGMMHSFSSTFPTTVAVSSVIATATTPFSPQSRVETTLGPPIPIPSERIDNGQLQRSTWLSANNNNNIQQDEYISDLDDEIEHLTCDVCDRAFHTLKQLADHQRKKRHYGCLQCDSIFPSREVLECHREQMCHYDYAIHYEDEGSESDDSFITDDDENGLIDSEDCDDEERERLL